MAFVYRSSSRDKFLDMNPIPLGPGQYNPEISKTEGRLKHQKGMKFSKIIKISHSPQIIPFNTTSQRSQIIKFDNYQPGPGAYTLTERKKNNNNYSSFSTEREIADILSMNNQNSEFKGFLSSEKRFNTDKRNITDENAITYDRAIRSFGKYIYYKCYNDEIGYNLALKFVKLIPPIHDLAESEKVCVEFLDQINEERNNILLQEEIKEETKNAVNRIIQLNQQENFIDDFTKILKACMTLELNFSHLVD